MSLIYNLSKTKNEFILTYICNETGLPPPFVCPYPFQYGIQDSGLRHIHMATREQKTDETAPTHQRWGNCQNIIRQDAVIILMANILALRGTAPFCSQL